MQGAGYNLDKKIHNRWVSGITAEALKPFFGDLSKIVIVEMVIRSVRVVYIFGI